MNELIELIPDATIIVSFEGKITYANQKAIDLFGYKREELIGSVVETLVPDRKKTKHENLRTVWMKNPKHRKFSDSEYMLLEGQTKIGQVIPLDIMLIPVGRQYVVAVLRNLNAYKKVVTRLKELSSRAIGVSEKINGNGKTTD